MAWSWGRPDAVRLAVTAVGADGRERLWCEDLRPGPGHAWTIMLPDGTRITIVRPVRVRVDLSRRH